MHAYLIDFLVCPACHGRLEWTIGELNRDRIESASAHCTACSAVYPVREGIGVFLTPEKARHDPWEEMDSGLIGHLREHPEIERKLMGPSLEALAPADQFFRALALEERGDFNAARIAEASAIKSLYSTEYLECSNLQLDYVVQQLAATDGPIVDLASGRGYLVERLARTLKRTVVATDLSPRVLRRDRGWLESLGLYSHVSLVAFDARCTPFKDGAVQNMTTNLGLPNIEQPGSMMAELRRIVSGAFLAVCHFFPEEDQANGKVIRGSGLEPFLYRRTALEHYAGAGWQVEVKNSIIGEARPTPPGVLLEGIRIDGLPVADTRLEWCTLLGE